MINLFLESWRLKNHVEVLFHSQHILVQVCTSQVFCMSVFFTEMRYLMRLFYYNGGINDASMVTLSEVATKSTSNVMIHRQQAHAYTVMHGLQSILFIQKTNNSLYSCVACQWNELELLPNAHFLTLTYPYTLNLLALLILESHAFYFQKQKLNWVQKSTQSTRNYLFKGQIIRATRHAGAGIL